MKKTNQVNPSTVEKPSIQVAGRNIRARFSLSKIEGGKFSLKLNNTDKRNHEGVSVEHCSGSDSSSSSNYTPSFLKPSTHAKSEFQGENETLSTFNNIEIVRTPKRKMKVSVSVASLISDFSAGSGNLPGTEGNSESPAKRRRLWGQGGQGH